jgi:hypothetical protein
MTNDALAGWAARRAASPAASTRVGASPAWSRNTRPAAVNSIPRALRVMSSAPTSITDKVMLDLTDRATSQNGPIPRYY